jgi:hypothetical protein
VYVLDGEQHVDGAEEEKQEVNPQEVVPVPDEGLGARVAREVDAQVHKASMLEVELLSDYPIEAVRHWVETVWQDLL